jgi:O-antigen/teichoic acid export membrane protein
LAESDGDGGLLGALRRAGPLAIAGAITNGAGVLVTVFIARLLTSRDYGAWGQLAGLFLVLSMPGSALIVAVVRRVSAWESAGEGWRVGRWIASMRRRGLVALGAWILVAVAVRWALADALSLRTPAGVSEVLVAGGIWALLSIDRGLLQARTQYTALATNLGVEAGVRTVVMVGLAAAGVGVGGVAIGQLCAMVAADAHARWVTSDRSRGDRVIGGVARRRSPDLDVQAVEPAAVAAEAVLSDPPSSRQLAVDLVAALGALALLAALQSVDVIFYGRHDPKGAGDYNAISVASKVLVFLAVVLGGYVLPEAATLWHRGEKAVRQLGAGIAILSVPAAALLLVSVAAPKLFIGLAFGKELDDAASALSTLALAMTLLAVNVLLVMYLLAVGRFVVLVPLTLAAGAAAVGVNLADGVALATARADLLVEAALFAVTLVLVARVRPPAPAPTSGSGPSTAGTAAPRPTS